tara:strand:+ start:789 stop:1097 length:309 start_codon:yes stop_codon:yes gene_type:complete
LSNVSASLVELDALVVVDVLSVVVGIVIGGGGDKLSRCCLAEVNGGGVDGGGGGGNTTLFLFITRSVLLVLFLNVDSGGILGFIISESFFLIKVLTVDIPKL